MRGQGGQSSPCLAITAAAVSCLYISVQGQQPTTLVAPRTGPTVADGSQAVPYFSETISVVEAENFTVLSGEWEARAWAHSPGYFASNSANDFLSRRAYLHAPAHAINGTVAASLVSIKGAGTYTVLLRYEALYRFETPVLVTVAQEGKVLLSRVYGYRESPKVWGVPYGAGNAKLCPYPTAECVWPWGATDNTVWEGVGVTVDLKPGVATVTLEVSHTTPPGVPLDSARFADRNIDVLMLTPNASDLQMRLVHEFGEVQFDGLLSQAGEVFFGVTNYGKTNFSLVVPRVFGHGAGWWEGSHLAQPIKTGPNTYVSGCTFQGGPECPIIEVDAGKTSPWVDVGAQMDVLQHGSWNLHGLFHNWTAKFANGTGPPVYRGAVPFSDYKITVGMKLSNEPLTSIVPIGTFDCNGNKNGFVQLLFDASTRASKRVRSQAQDFYEILNELDAQTPLLHGRAPTQTPIYAGTFSAGPPSGGGGEASSTCPKCGSDYNESVKRYNSMFNIQSTAGMLTPAERSNMSYIDIRGSIGTPEALAAELEKLTNASLWPGGPVADDILTVSLGDEIGVAGSGTDVGFIRFLEAREQKPLDVGCEKSSWSSVLSSCNQTTGACAECGMNTSISVAVNPATQRLYYFSRLYENEEGLLRFRTITSTIQKALPRAKIGANFSPLQFFTDPRDGIQYCQMYSPDPFQWIRFFREGGATLPWSEDWVWMTPVGSQQMVGVMVDMMRSALTTFPSTGQLNEPTTEIMSRSGIQEYKRVPLPRPAIGPPILMYVMAHFPGNTINSWRRQFFQDIAHGVKFFDLFDFVPSYSGYTCDYVDSDGGAYPNVRRALNELGTFEDIVQNGAAQAQGTAVAILASESSNYWLRNAGTQGAAKRTLYIALRHGGYPIDFVLEEDCVAGHLKHYSALYVVDAQVSEAATAAINAWANIGGIVVATAGALAQNEFNLTSTAVGELLAPVNQTALWVGPMGCPQGVQDHRCQRSRVQLSKQDLAFVDELDRVFVSDGTSMEQSTGVYGEKAMFTIEEGPAKGAMAVQGTFRDGQPAILNVSHGLGTVWYYGFHPGLAYFRTALPDTEPPCKGSTDDSYNHWVPTDFDATAANALYAPLQGIPGARPVTSIPQLVEVGVVTSLSERGTVLPLINWSNDPIDEVTVLLHFDLPHPVASVATATGVNVTMSTSAEGYPMFTMPLEIAADAIILRA